jgi:hypothetical protein
MKCNMHNAQSFPAERKQVFGGMWERRTPTFGFAYTPYRHGLKPEVGD